MTSSATSAAAQRRAGTPSSELRPLVVTAGGGGSKASYADGDGDSEPLEPIAASSDRFAQLAVFSAGTFLSVLNYSVLTPVYMVGEARFQVGLQALNALGNIRTASYVPGVVLALYVTERFGFRTSCLWGYGTQLFAALVAGAAVALPLPPHAAYALLLGSQAFSALGVAMFQNNLTRLSSEFFPAEERDAAVTIASLAGVAGTVFISLAAPAEAMDMHLDALFTLQVPAWAAVALAAAIVVKDEPAQPPSVAAALQRRERRAARARGGASAFDATMSHLLGLLFLNHNFMALNWSSNLVIQVVYAVVAVMGPMLQPCGISATATGIALAAFSVGSAASPLLYLARVADERRGGVVAYLEHQRAWTLTCLVGLAAVLALHAPGESAAAAVGAWLALGLLSGVMGNSGLTLEHGAEMTYPMPANASMCALTIVGNLISCLQVLGATALVVRGAEATCSRVVTPLAWFVAANCAAGVALLALLRREYRRAAAESADVGSGGGGGGAYGAALKGASGGTAPAV